MYNVQIRPLDHFLIIAGSIVVFLICRYILFPAHGYVRNCTSINDKTSLIIQESLGVSFPSNSVLVKASIVQGKDSALVVRFDMPKAGLNNFINSFQYPTEEINDRIFQLENTVHIISWWKINPASVKLALSGTDRYVRVIICNPQDSSSQMYEVFMRTSGKGSRLSSTLLNQF